MKRLLSLLLFIPSLAYAQVVSVPAPTLNSLSGMNKAGSNATAGTVKDNLGLVRDLVKDFGAVCDGTTDDAVAFAAATAWLATGPGQRLVTIPASTSGCATSATVTLGDGRQQNTTLTALLTGTGTTATVASCTGIQAGDNLVIVRDAGTTYAGTVATCVGTTLTLGSAYSGTDASSGKPVYTGKASTYNGGGFVGYGSGVNGGEFPGAPSISSIKYIGSAAPTTTLTATPGANATTLTVASTANMSLGAPLGITLDNARVWWTTVDYIASATSVVIMNEMPSTATSGNTVTIASNPVLRVAGPIIAPRVEGIKLNANALAAIGLDVQHSFGGKFQGPRGVLAFNYTGIGHFYHSTRAYFGLGVGSADNDFEPYAMSPNNTKTIGCWYLGSAGAIGTQLGVAFSRNRFWGGTCTMGGNDVTAASIREEFADNNTWYRPYALTNGASTSGAGIYRQPSHSRTGFPGGNIYFGPSLAATGVTDGADAGGAVVGPNSYFGWNTESTTFPTTNAWGTTDVGGLQYSGGWGSNTAWATFSPTLTCGTGSFTSASASTSRYKQVGKTVYYTIIIVITTNGTCATATLATLPMNFNASGQYAAPGRNNSSGGGLIAITSGTNQIRITTPANAYSGADGQTLVITGTYEAS